MANNSNTARKPAAAKGDKLAQALAGVTYPAADNAAAWLALLADLPALAEIVAASRAGKYGNGKGLVPGAGDMLAATRYGATVGAQGFVKNGKPNAQAATCRAAMLATAATGADKACKAALVFFLLTHADCLTLLRACKAVQYVGRTGTPCPAWAAGYVNGNVRADMLAKG